MIAYLRGKINFKADNFLIIENNGIGYKVFISEKVLAEKNINDEIELFTYHNIREDAMDLYGFLSFEELDLFGKLISVSGIGPKTGLGVFAIAEVKDIKSAIINQDATILKKVSGIGAKTAERIVLELKNKISGVIGVDIKSQAEMTIDTDAIEALESLGYQGSQAREALQKVPAEVTDAGERVKMALKFLGK